MARIRGIFNDWDTLKSALGTLKDTRGSGYTAYGPVDLTEIEDLMPAKSSFVRGWATAGGLFGLALFLAMCVITSIIFNLVVGGKPPISNLPYVIPTYEGVILLGAICAFIAGLVYARIRMRPLPEDYDTRFSGDTFGVEVTCDAAERDGVIDLLKKTGAVEVYDL